MLGPQVKWRLVSLKIQLHLIGECFLMLSVFTTDALLSVDAQPHSSCNNELKGCELRNFAEILFCLGE